MDSLTHLTAGVITPFAFKRYPRTWALVIFGIICAELPDIDSIAGQSAYTIFFIHRGITHSLPVVFAAALLLGLVASWWFKKSQTVYSAANGLEKKWAFPSLFACALLTLLVGHLYLDCMTTFGTRIFLPFSSYRVALPAMFIVDPLFTVPLIAAAVFIIKWLHKPEKRQKQTKLARVALAWIIIYPLCTLSTAFYVEVRANAELAGQGVKAHVLTEVFSPFIWKIVEEREDSYTLSVWYLFSPSSSLKEGKSWPKPEPVLWKALRHAEPLFEGHASFGAYTVESREALADGGQIVTYAEMRYFSAMENLFRLAGREDGLFLMQAKLDAQNRLVASRYLGRGKDAASTPWHVYPVPFQLSLQ